MTIYEFRRGVLAGIGDAAAARQSGLFLANFAVAEMNTETWEKAAQIWAAMRKIGIATQRRDGDILIAATAAEAGFAVITRNTADFRTISQVCEGLLIVPW